MPPAEDTPIPYRIACLCEIRDRRGRLLMLHRVKHPNRDLYSPIGGKLEQHTGESPTACALREIAEEVGLALAHDDLRLLGIISERAYASDAGDTPKHWLMFWFRVLPPIEPTSVPRAFDEGTLEWIPEPELVNLPLPATDRDAIWPAVLDHSDNTDPNNPALGFFALHIDCTATPPAATIEESVPPTPAAAPATRPHHRH